MKGRIQSLEVIILGAGASAGFTPIEPPFVETSLPFPMANDFFEKAIKHQILKGHNLKGDPLNKALLGFIQDKFGLSFKDLKVNKLSVEEVYIELERLIENRNKLENWTDEELNLYYAKRELLEVIKELFSKLSRHYGPCKYHTILAERVVENESVVISFNWDILMDGALYNTDKWFYETGYGIKFKRIYFSKKEILGEGKKSKGLLLKPHGSINWFRYEDLAWSNKNGFTAEPVSESEMEETHLFEFLKKRPPRTHPVHMRLYLGKDYNPPIKKPAEIDIIPPIPPGQGSKLEERPAFKRICGQTYLAIRNAEKIIAIGYALKEPSIRLRFKNYRGESNKPLLLTLVNKSVIDPEFVKNYKEIFNPDKVDLFHSFEEFCNAIKL